MFKKTTLKNGLRIITVPQKSTQAVTVLVLVGAGSKYETKDINGISHFLEHLFFKGTKKRPSTMAIAETLDRVGGIYNAFTSQEYTGYFAKVKAEYLELALDWVSDIFLNSKLEPEEIKREKGVIFEEINMHFDNPMAFVEILWYRLLYGDQPAGWDVAGTKQSVAALSHQKLLNYRSQHYSSHNTIVCLAGKIENSQVIQKVKKCFSKIRTKKPLSKLPVKESQKQSQCLVHHRKTDQTHVCLGVRAPDIFSPQKYAAELLAVILGGMMSSRLFIKVRERMGLAYYITTGLSAFTDAGYLLTQSGVRNDKIGKVISAILQEYKRISQTKVGARELKKAKDFLKGKTALLLEASDARASFYGLQELLKKEILSSKQIYAKIDRVTVDDILKLSQDIFQPRKLNLALIGPFKNKEKFQKLLKL